MNPLTGRFVSLLACILFAAALAAPSAHAQIVVDPEGPAGKQYSDSLDDARAEANGADPRTAVPGATEDPPLFGEGVEPAGEDEGSGGAAGGGGGESGGAGGEGAASGYGTADVDDGGNGLPLALLIAAAVGVIGVGAAFGAGRMRGPAST